MSNKDRRTFPLGRVHWPGHIKFIDIGSRTNVADRSKTMPTDVIYTTNYDRLLENAVLGTATAEAAEVDALFRKLGITKVQLLEKPFWESSHDLAKVPEPPLKPPPAAEKLLSFLISPGRLEERLGDFEEKFGFLAMRHGIGHARRWYWWQLISIALRDGFDAALQAAKIWFGPA
jgi:hypothetical protein